MKQFLHCNLVYPPTGTTTPLWAVGSPAKPAPFGLAQGGFQTQALNPRARFSGLAVIPSAIKRGLHSLFHGTEPPRRNREAARLAITGAATVTSLWVGLHSSVAAIPS